MKGEKSKKICTTSLLSFYLLIFYSQVQVCDARDDAICFYRPASKKYNCS